MAKKLTTTHPGYDWKRLEEFGLPERKLRDAIALTRKTAKPVTAPEAYDLLKAAHRFQTAVSLAQHDGAKALAGYLQVVKYPAQPGSVFTKKKMEKIASEA